MIKTSLVTHVMRRKGWGSPFSCRQYEGDTHVNNIACLRRLHALSRKQYKQKLNLQEAPSVSNIKIGVYIEMLVTYFDL